MTVRVPEESRSCIDFFAVVCCSLVIPSADEFDAGSVARAASDVGAETFESALFAPCSSVPHGSPGVQCLVLQSLHCHSHRLQTNDSVHLAAADHNQEPEDIQPSGACQQSLVAIGRHCLCVACNKVDSVDTLTQAAEHGVQ